METPENNIDKLKAKPVFKVPEKYFDQLATEIQTKAITSKNASVIRFPLVLKYAFPVVLLTVAVVFWMQGNDVKSTKDIHELLADIPADDIIEYLDESDLSMTDIIDILDTEVVDMEYYFDDSDSLSNEELELLLDDYDLTGEFL